MIPSDRSPASPSAVLYVGQHAAIEFDPVTRRRIAVFHGPIEDADLFDAYGALLERPDYDCGADDLVDLQRVTHMGVTSNGLRRLMGMFAEVDAKGIRTRCAIVAPEDAVYGVSRMWQLMREDAVSEELCVFRVMRDAEEWLAVGRRRASA
jgi:hypothetical protein